MPDDWRDAISASTSDVSLGTDSTQNPSGASDRNRDLWCRSIPTDGSDSTMPALRAIAWVSISRFASAMDRDSQCLSTERNEHFGKMSKSLTSKIKNAVTRRAAWAGHLLFRSHARGAAGSGRALTPGAAGWGRSFSRTSKTVDASMWDDDSPADAGTISCMRTKRGRSCTMPIL